LLHGLDSLVGALGSGDNDDRDAFVDATDLLEKLQSGLIRQVQVEDNDIG